jgi:DNA-binding NtrC family response regulator
MGATRILLVDDEIALTGLIEKYLLRMGFDVHSVTDSRAALEQFHEAEPPFEIVIADMSMPDLSGEDLLRAMFSSNAAVRGILCSGYAVAGTALAREYHGRVDFLQKPFLPKMLADTVHRLVGSIPAADAAHPASSNAT